jgi:hypothetical protein
MIDAKEPDLPDDSPRWRWASKKRDLRGGHGAVPYLYTLHKCVSNKTTKCPAYWTQSTVGMHQTPAPCHSPVTPRVDCVPVACVLRRFRGRSSCRDRTRADRRGSQF